jgi:hypothetical protein
MVVKGFQLPAAFVDLFHEGGIPYSTNEACGVDAYGNPWECELELHVDLSSFEWWSDHLQEAFSCDPNDPPPQPPYHSSGFIPYIDDFSQIVCFGTGHEGSPFCFDYRANQDTPSIIYWDDIYWRRVAPDFETLLTLFEPVADEEMEGDSEGGLTLPAPGGVVPPPEPTPIEPGDGKLKPQPGWSEETCRVADGLGKPGFMQFLQSEHAAGRLQQGRKIWNELLSVDHLPQEEPLPPEESAE